jgi:glycosyltransferase involved in cell wall biosynthesis
MKKILHIYKTFHTKSSGGIERVIYNICNAVSTFENAVFVAGKSLVKDVKVQTTFSFFTLFSMPIAPFFIPKIWLNYRKTDILTCHYPMPLSDVAVALYFPKNKKLIYWWHAEINKQKFLKYFFMPFTYLALKKASKICILDISLLEHSKILTKFKHKVLVIPYGLEDMNLDENMSNKSDVVVVKEPFILSIGRLVPYKGFENLIYAMKDINFNLVIIGKGPDYNKLTTLINRLHLNSKITILTNIDDFALQKYISACSFFVLPSKNEAEAFGIVQVEAMRSSKAIINCRLKSAVPSCARHMIEAITVEPDNIEELAAAILELLKNETLRNKLGKNGRNRFEEKYHYRHFAMLVNKLYNEI